MFFLDYIPEHVAQNVEVHLSQTIRRGFCSRERMIICNYSSLALIGKNVVFSTILPLIGKCTFSNLLRHDSELQEKTRDYHRKEEGEGGNNNGESSGKQWSRVVV